MANTGWMENNQSSQSALGPLSSGSSRYKVIKMTPYERKRKALFEDFRSRIIDKAQLLEELEDLKAEYGIHD